jgi:hypothetical protein
MIRGTAPKGLFQGTHHHNGRNWIINQRGVKQFDTENGRCLYVILHEQHVSLIIPVTPTRSNYVIDIKEHSNTSKAFQRGR